MWRAIVVLSYVIACFRYGAWRRWREFYSTYLYVVIGDLTYNFIFYEKSLWLYDRLVSHVFSDLLVAAIVFPCAITLFLTYYPRKLWRQALYILAWSAVNTILEYISYKIGFILYDNHWHILWSLLLYCIAFTLVRVHYTRPLIVWPISLVCACATMLIFQVPLTGMR